MDSLDILLFQANQMSKQCCIPTATASNTLPNGNLILKPGIYRLWDLGEADFSNEGLYRIIDYKHERSFQSIVYHSDITELLVALARIFTHGFDDNNQRLHDWMPKAIFKNMAMECGPTAVSCFKLLTSLGVPCRVVSIQHSHQPYNTGHVFNEVFFDNQWRLVDFNKKIMIADMQANPLSLKDVIAMGGFAHTKIIPLCATPIPSSNGNACTISKHGLIINYSFNAEYYSLDNVQNLHQWLAQHDIYILSDNPIYEMHVLGDGEYIKTLHFYTKDYYIPLCANDFISRFYGTYS